jgi:hypothetical protein
MLAHEFLMTFLRLTSPATEGMTTKIETESKQGAGCCSQGMSNDVTTFSLGVKNIARNSTESSGGNGRICFTTSAARVDHGDA